MFMCVKLNSFFAFFVIFEQGYPNPFQIHQNIVQESTDYKSQAMFQIPEVNLITKKLS